MKVRNLSRKKIKEFTDPPILNCNWQKRFSCLSMNVNENLWRASYKRGLGATPRAHDSLSGWVGPDNLHL